MTNKTDDITLSKTNESGKVISDGLRQMKLERDKFLHYHTQMKQKSFMISWLNYAKNLYYYIEKSSGLVFQTDFTLKLISCINIMSNKQKSN